MFVKADRNMSAKFFSGVSTVDYDMLGDMSFSIEATHCSLDLKQCEKWGNMNVE